MVRLLCAFSYLRLFRTVRRIIEVDIYQNFAGLRTILKLCIIAKLYILTKSISHFGTS